MRVVALLALFFGFCAQMIAAGQPFASAVFGIVSALIAIACGLISTRKRTPDRWAGFVLSILGFGLVVWCLILAPSAYAYEQRSAARKKKWASEQSARAAAADSLDVTEARERAALDGLNVSMNDEQILRKIGEDPNTLTSRRSDGPDGFSINYTNETRLIIITRSLVTGVSVLRLQPKDQHQHWMFGRPQP